MQLPTVTEPRIAGDWAAVVEEVWEDAFKPRINNWRYKQRQLWVPKFLVSEINPFDSKSVCNITIAAYQELSSEGFKRSVGISRQVFANPVQALASMEDTRIKWSVTLDLIKWTCCQNYLSPAQVAQLQMARLVDAARQSATTPKPPTPLVEPALRRLILDD